MDKKKLIDTREKYIEMVKKNLLGPGSEISIPDEEHELISDNPYARYSLGILYPIGMTFVDDEKDMSTDDDEDGDNRAELRNDEGFVNHRESIASMFGTDAEIGVDEEDDGLDDAVNLSSQNMPSSMGIMFFAKGNVENVTVNVRFATYEKVSYSMCRTPFNEEIDAGYDVVEEPFSSFVYIDKEEKTLRPAKSFKKSDLHKIREKIDVDTHDVLSRLYMLADQIKNGHVRVPHSCDIVLDFSSNEYIDQNDCIDNTPAKITALRKHIKDDIYSITIMMVNTAKDAATEKKCLLQPEILVTSNNSCNKFFFVEYAMDNDENDIDEEEQSLNLQYRNKKIYAVGLGTSATWSVNEYGEGLISTDFFPTYEVPSVDFMIADKYNVDDSVFSMKYLSDLMDEDKKNKIIKIKKLVAGYTKWIDELKVRKNVIPSNLQSIAAKNIKGCEASAARMEAGIMLLNSNEKVWEAFELANRAMYMQRIHLALQEDTSNINRYPNDAELGELLGNMDYINGEDAYFWRPFQLAFLLMSVNSIVNDDAWDRDLVDLIWFPTGGGKTEAYLFLTAFTIFYRRLAHLEEAGGTTVIMRYTLRLLAAQQFTRASTLICACEYIRRETGNRRSKYKKYALGKEEISIGLWIGGAHTPNKNENAKNELRCLMETSALTVDNVKDKHNKFQVLKCPWCGTKLEKDRKGSSLVGTWGYRMKDNKHFEIFCPQEGCYFYEIGKLPIQVVDEELYRKPPTLLFGTVDKFAMLPFKADIGGFFAVGSRNRCPELIIQDELHLISGPLGTMVGIYETALDEICKRKGKQTKIIASTATIRRAGQQCAALYNRPVAQFPHPGLDAEDSFFARDNKIDYSAGMYGRRYVGIMPSGKTKATMQIRAIGSMLQCIKNMELEDDVKDKFWTLTAYFNSLKDLGKCSTLVDDDIKDYIKRLAFRLGKRSNSRLITNADELTSRVSTTQLNATLDKLEKIAYSRENIENKRRPSDILLATNMISVGIDVARLNVMAMVGQPKLTSEYIQASSRAGRKYPGVVFVLSDASKSRDRSYYEQFYGFHSSFYKFVEPTGVTPFSKPARDRALHAVIISMMRLFVEDLRDTKDAAVFTKEKYEAVISEVTESIIKRSNDITMKVNNNMTSDESEIKKEIEEFFDQWEDMAGKYGEGKFSYGENYLVKSPPEGVGRLMKPFMTDIYSDAMDTMTSMRNVDGAARVGILIWGN